MDVKIGIEAAQFPEKEYINGIFVAVLNMYLITVKKVSEEKHENT
jgi:hypothetical protein